MSNLGDYQKMVILAKKVGNPKKLAALTMVIGSAALGSTQIVIKKSSKMISQHKKNQKEKKKALREVPNKIYTINHKGKSGDGLEFNIGDQFKVLSTVEDVMLIEVLENENNPYCVSFKLLKRISDFK